MVAHVPIALAENAGLAFIGERIPPATIIVRRTAVRMVGLRNNNGRSNADVLRPLAGAGDRNRPGSRWQISFPPEMSEAEAGFYAAPFRHLARATTAKRGAWWVNPAADSALRAALARRERFLATPRTGNQPEFFWLDASVIPDQSLLVVAREDDFFRGLLLSHLFSLWWRYVQPSPKTSLVLESFPFPWPPGTGLGGLTLAQEETRHAIARADRIGDTESLNAAVSAGYVLPANLTRLPLLAPEKNATP